MTVDRRPQLAAKRHCEEACAHRINDDELSTDGKKLAGLLLPFYPESRAVVTIRHAAAREALSTAHALAGQLGNSVMGDILVKCPHTLKSVPTGLKAEWVVLGSLPPVAIPFPCTACGQIHKWKREDAWIGHASQEPKRAGAVSRGPDIVAKRMIGA
jgi:hypothetical protein